MENAQRTSLRASLRAKALGVLTLFVGLFLVPVSGANAGVVGESLPLWGTLNPGDYIEQVTGSGTMKLVMEQDGGLVLYRVFMPDGTHRNQVCDFSGTSGSGLHADFIVDLGIGPILRVADGNGTTIRYFEGASTGGAMNVSFSGAQVYIGNAVWSTGNSTGCF